MKYCIWISAREYAAMKQSNFISIYDSDLIGNVKNENVHTGAKSVTVSSFHLHKPPTAGFIKACQKYWTFFNLSY